MRFLMFGFRALFPHNAEDPLILRGDETMNMTQEEINNLKIIFSQALILNSMTETMLKPLHFTMWRESVTDDLIQKILLELETNGLPTPPNHLAVLNILYNFIVLPWELLKKPVEQNVWQQLNRMVAAKSEYIKNEYNKKADIRMVRNAIAHGDVNILDPFIFHGNKITFKIKPPQLHEIVSEIISIVVIPCFKLTPSPQAP